MQTVNKPYVRRRLDPALGEHTGVVYIRFSTHKTNHESIYASAYRFMIHGGSVLAQRESVTADSVSSRP